MMDHLKARRLGARRRNRKPLRLKAMWASRRDAIDLSIAQDRLQAIGPLLPGIRYGKPTMLAPFRELHPREEGEYGVPTDRDYDEER